MNNITPIIIPAFEPDNQLPHFIQRLKNESNQPIIIVDDGSGSNYKKIFCDLKNNNNIVLTHEENRGKGAALKTAFQYVLEKWPDAIGVVTADSDGQHTPECIKAVSNALVKNSQSLILGVRSFDSNDVPWKSKLGNNLTIKTFQLLTGTRVSDTQTGLRGIPINFMKELLNIKNDRFEFEMKMLIDSINNYPIVEIPIKTIYDSKENHRTHFDPVRDSIKIYRILLGQFIRYSASALSSSVIDLLLFQVFCMLLKYRIASYIALSTIVARVLSAIYNYNVNYKFVFKSKEKTGISAVKYFILAVIICCLSALFVTLGVKFLAFIPELVIKIVVDSFLFVLSYFIQKSIIFK